MPRPNIREVSGKCWFDVWEETQGFRHDCDQLATQPWPTDPEHLHPDGVATLLLCDRHHAYVEGYIAGQWDGRGRPETFDADQITQAFTNAHECPWCAQPSRVIGTHTINTRSDPTEAYRLECGHTVI